MGWKKIADLRGPAGYNATGAAEDAAAVGAFMRGMGGPNDAHAALTEVTGVNVRNFGAVGDGANDDTVAVQAAIDAAGDGGKVIFPPGEYKLGSITTLLHQTIEGTSQLLGTGPTPATRLLFSELTGTQAGVNSGENVTYRDLIVWGPGYVGNTTGVYSASGSPRFERVGFYQWPRATHLVGAYYTNFEQCEWSYSAVGVKLDNCYNVSVIAPRFNLANSDFTAFGTAFEGAARALNIFGGSIEHYGAASAILPVSGQAVNLFGVYFESGQASAPWGIKAELTDKVSITMLGCLIYLFGHSRFIALGGTTNATLTSHGNKFVSSSASPTTPIAYVFGSSPTADVNIHGDDFTEVQKGTYCDNVAALAIGTLSGMNIRVPATSDPTTLGAREHIGRHLMVAGVMKTGSGATGARPVASSLPAGSQWYDTTLNKPIWASGSSWRDAAGTVV